jgi:phosphoribosylformylglycinamidine synthase
MASGVGAVLEAQGDDGGDHAFWFGEDQGRYVLAVTDAPAVLAAAAAAGVPAVRLGRSQGGDLVVGAAGAISVASLVAAHEATLPRLMQGV